MEKIQFTEFTTDSGEIYVKAEITPEEYELLKCDSMINFVPFPPEGQGKAIKHVAYGTISQNRISQLENALDKCK